MAESNYPMNTIKITKSQLMQPVIAGEQHECFEDSELGIFDVTAMREACKAGRIGELTSIPLDQIIPMLAEQRVVDPDRVDELDEKSWRDDPGIFILTGFDEENIPNVCMVDGHHRAMRRHIEQLDNFVAYFVPVEQAIRPGEGWTKNPFVDWGDPIVEGKIIRE